jgi:hypothetical protein
VTARWRGYAFANAELANRQLRVARDLLGALEARGVSAGVVKGIALSAQLYGNFGMRPSGDVDVCIRADDRDAAHGLLLALGLEYVKGHAPEEGQYLYRDGAYTVLVEVHSCLLDDTPMIAPRLPLPLPQSIRISEGELSIVTGPVLIAYLATQLACMGQPTLLRGWEFGLMWEQAGKAQQEEVEAIATTWRLRGFLSWALEFSATVRRVADDDAGAIDRLRRYRQELHAGRVIGLSSGVSDGLVSTFRWILPPDVRRNAPAMARLLALRTRRLIRWFARRPDWRRA